MPKYEWDAGSATRKLISDNTITVSVGNVSVSKNTPPHNPKTDAYRSCKNCKKHVNYHKKGNCPK